MNPDVSAGISYPGPTNPLLVQSSFYSDPKYPSSDRVYRRRRF
jgi:hypothetical protein